MERPVQAEEPCGRENPRIRRSREAERTKRVAKPAEWLSGKAAIAYHGLVP